MWPVNVSRENIQNLSSEPYVVAPKPVGPRCLLFIDFSGRVFIENMTQHIFRMEDRYAFEMFNNRTIADTVLDGIFSQERSSTTGKWTYWVQDAIRCSGEDLTGYGILKRMAVVKVNKKILLLWHLNSI